MTRADQIRNMSNDELANFLCELVAPDGCTFCPFRTDRDGQPMWCGAIPYLNEEVDEKE